MLYRKVDELVEWSKLNGIRKYQLVAEVGKVFDGREVIKTAEKQTNDVSEKERKKAGTSMAPRTRDKTVPTENKTKEMIVAFLESSTEVSILKLIGSAVLVNRALTMNHDLYCFTQDENKVKEVSPSRVDDNF